MISIKCILLFTDEAGLARDNDNPVNIHIFLTMDQRTLDEGSSCKPKYLFMFDIVYNLRCNDYKFSINRPPFE